MIVCNNIGDQLIMIFQLNFNTFLQTTKKYDDDDNAKNGYNIHKDIVRSSTIVCRVVKASVIWYLH